VVRCTIGSRGEVPEERKPVIRCGGGGDDEIGNEIVALLNAVLMLWVP
jgi:hypothetical protein